MGIVVHSLKRKKVSKGGEGINTHRETYNIQCPSKLQKIYKVFSNDKNTFSKNKKTKN
jgi:hypothetical protein